MAASTTLHELGHAYDFGETQHYQWRRIPKNCTRKTTKESQIWIARSGRTTARRTVVSAEEANYSLNYSRSPFLAPLVVLTGVPQGFLAQAFPHWATPLVKGLSKTVLTVCRVRGQILYSDQKEQQTVNKPEAASLAKVLLRLAFSRLFSK